MVSHLGHRPLPNLRDMTDAQRLQWLIDNGAEEWIPVLPPGDAWCWLFKSPDLGRALWDSADLLNRLSDREFPETSFEVAFMVRLGFRVLAHDPDLEALRAEPDSNLLIETVTADLAQGLSTWAYGECLATSKMVPISLAQLDDLSLDNDRLQELEAACLR